MAVRGRAIGYNRRRGPIGAGERLGVVGPCPGPGRKALQGVCPARHRIDGAEGPLRRVIVEVTAATPSRQLGKEPVGKEWPKSGELAGTRPEGGMCAVKPRP